MWVNVKKQNTRDNALLVRKTNMLGQETVGEKMYFLSAYYMQ